MFICKYICNIHISFAVAVVYRFCLSVLVVLLAQKLQSQNTKHKKYILFLCGCLFVFALVFAVGCNMHRKKNKQEFDFFTVYKFYELAPPKQRRFCSTCKIKLYKTTHSIYTQAKAKQKRQAKAVALFVYGILYLSKVLLPTAKAVASGLAVRGRFAFTSTDIII